MANSVKPVPQGFHTLTPYLTVNDAARAIDFYVKALGAREVMRMQNPAGKITHAELKIGDSMLMVSDELGQSQVRSPRSLSGTTTGIFLYVENVDSVFDRAVATGAKPVSRPADMFWGDRFGTFADPFGHVWSVATHIEDVTPQEMERRAKAAMAKMGQGQPQTA